MATGADAITAIADATGLLPATVGRAARALREAGGDLWPQSMPGGGRNARHVQPHHLVNLTLALMGADPITDAPELVSFCRCLWRDEAADQTFGGADFIVPGRFMIWVKFNTNVDRSATRRLSAQSSFLTETLGESHSLGTAMDAVVKQLGYRADSQQAIVDDSMFIELRTGAAIQPSASILWASPKAFQLFTYSSRREQNFRDSLRHGAKLDRTTTVRAGLVTVLADLWRDTMNSPGRMRQRAHSDQATADG
jgi:hypothetical protein